jgi:hypothetical protein
MFDVHYYVKKDTCIMGRSKFVVFFFIMFTLCVANCCLCDMVISKHNCICMPIYTKGITKYVHMIMLKHAKLVISFEASTYGANIILKGINLQMMFAYFTSLLT